ncbi:hypothetical protein BTJ68_09657 [Lecanosticta acicola]|uniref:DNA/RNA-binding protein Alba-like domain-containing protein n=1 Tax=Lecanosticta acicola TaxID=111012 RepID=A0AAI8YZW2_9PEZI|nr:hypothetical protein BTJ68_09657 [Lecanosticta acicola]
MAAPRDGAPLPQENYNLVNLSVLSSTQISNRTSAVLSNLQAEDSDNQSRTPIVALTAKPKAAPKLISIIEIVKRDLASKNIKCFQYNALKTEYVRMLDDAGGSADVLETMPGARGTDRGREVPLMTIYLSTVSIRELKAEYGEQT